MQRDLEERNRVIQTLKNDLNVVQKENQELTRQVYIFFNKNNFVITLGLKRSKIRNKLRTYRSSDVIIYMVKFKSSKLRYVLKFNLQIESGYAEKNKR